MASGIDPTYDMIYSNEGTEWHRSAIHTPVITRQTIKKILWPIIESPTYMNVDGNMIEIENHKSIAADMRTCRDDLNEGERILPLHTPKAGYRVITNSEVWDMMEETIKDLGGTITSVGTLERGKKFFISVSIGDSDMIINKDQYKFFLNFVTSHDGSINLFLYDSAMRIVCMNTLKWSMNDRNIGDIQLKISHKKNATLAIQNLPVVVNSILSNRTKLKEVMEYLNECRVDRNEAIAMTAGYFADDKEQKISTQAYNSINDIVNLFENGIACYGETLYDLANAATEFWTTGRGTGNKNATDAQRVYRSAMGTSADNKTDFISMLNDENRRNSNIMVGREAYKKYLMDSKK